MRRMRKGVLLAVILHLLVSVVSSHTTEVPEDGEEYEGDVGTALPPLKLPTSICAMKADRGPCKALHDRYHFNLKTRQCELFNYGGCEGNENNFLTLEECQEKCIVPDLPEKKTRRFKKERPSYCLLENDPGICRGLITRYFYNKESQKCEKFQYGGCLGNQNNFWYLEECQDTCQEINPSVNSLQTDGGSIPFTTADNSTPVDQHVLPANSLQTEDVSVPVSTVDNSTPVIQQVPLVPSTNSLKAQEDSMLLSISNNSTPVVKKGQGLLPSLCVMRVDRGLCRAQEKRFFFNYTIGKCRPFSYSGCGGNENNFSTRKSCLQMCKRGFLQQQGQKGIMKIRRKRKKQRVKLVDGEIVIERI